MKKLIFLLIALTKLILTYSPSAVNNSINNAS